MFKSPGLINSQLNKNYHQQQQNHNKSRPINLKQQTKLRSTTNLINNRNLKPFYNNNNYNNPLFKKQNNNRINRPSSQTRHSDPLPKSSDSPNSRGKTIPAKRKSLPNFNSLHREFVSKSNAKLNSTNANNNNRIPITDARRIQTSEDEGGDFIQRDNNQGGEDGTYDSDDEDEGDREGEEGESSDDDEEGSSSGNSSDDSSAEEPNPAPWNEGLETVDLNHINQTLRQLKKGSLLHKHEVEAQEIKQAFKASSSRSKVLFVDFLGGEITKELLACAEEIEETLSTGVRMYEGKKKRHLQKMGKDSEKIDQAILKISELTKNFFTRRQDLAKTLQTSRDNLEKELNSLRKSFEVNCQSVQSPSKSKSHRTTTTTGGGRKSRA